MREHLICTSIHPEEAVVDVAKRKLAKSTRWLTRLTDLCWEVGFMLQYPVSKKNVLWAIP